MFLLNDVTTPKKHKMNHSMKMETVYSPETSVLITHNTITEYLEPSKRNIFTQQDLYSINVYRVFIVTNLQKMQRVMCCQLLRMLK